MEIQFVEGEFEKSTKHKMCYSAIVHIFSYIVAKFLTILLKYLSFFQQLAERRVYQNLYSFINTLTISRNDYFEILMSL